MDGLSTGFLECQVEPALPNAQMRGLKTTPLIVKTARLCNTILQLQTNSDERADFTVEYYLNTTLLALRHGLGTGGDFRLPVNPENHDLRRVLSESFGSAFGILLMVRDLKAKWSSIAQITSKDISSSSKATIRLGMRRPDFLFDTPTGRCILECKGTTSKSSLGSMVRSAVSQVKKKGIVKRSLSGRYLACSYLPLLGQTDTPVIRACDPSPPLDTEPQIMIRQEVADVAGFLHYASATRVAGLDALSKLVRFRVNHPSEDRDRGLAEDARKELRDASEGGSRTFEIGNRTLIGRRVRVPARIPEPSQGTECPFYDVKIGIDFEIAECLLSHDAAELEKEIMQIEEVDEPLRTLLCDGSGIIIEPSSGKKAGIRYSWPDIRPRPAPVSQAKEQPQVRKEREVLVVQV